MTKKILSAILASVMVVSCMAFTANAADEKALYVEAEATGGDGSKEEPYGTLDEAVQALEGKDGTIYVVGSYNISGFKAPKWEGMVTVKGADSDAVISLNKSLGITFNGDITFKDINFAIEANAHFIWVWTSKLPTSA